MLKRHLIAVLAPVTLLAGCAGSGYGSSISGSGDALSPEERRLQAVEGKVTNLTRRLDSINLTGMDQESQRLRDDIRALRGEFERMRYDNDQQARRNKDLYMDLDRRLQRFEAPMGMNSSAVPPALPSTGMTTLPPTDGSAAAPAAGTAYGAAAASAPAVAAAPVAPPPTAPVGAASSGIAAPVVISSGSGASVEEETAYLAAFDELKNGKYDNAIKGFQSMLAKWPSGRYSDNAYYWMGEAQYVKRDYRSAVTSFQTLLQRFPTSAKAPDATLKMGLTQLELKQEADGRATLQRVIQTYPNSNAAKLAQQRLNPPR
jgi:tol-pal system protein YbgF